MLGANSIYAGQCYKEGLIGNIPKKTIITTDATVEDPSVFALEDDLWIKRALSVIDNIDFYKYLVSFKLHK